MLDLGKPLSGLIEIDETSISHRTRNGAVDRERSHKGGKTMTIGAVEIESRDEKNCRGRIRPSEFSNWIAQIPHGLVGREATDGSVVNIDESPSRTILPRTDHNNQVVGSQMDIDVFPEASFYHDLRANRLQSYLDEFKLDFILGLPPNTELESLPNLVMKSNPMANKMVIGYVQRVLASNLYLRMLLNVQS